MKDENLRALFQDLEANYKNLKIRGTKTIDIDMILYDLMRHRQ